MPCYSYPFFWESRLSFVGVQEVRLKEGIRFHNVITAFILRLLFGDRKIVDITDVDGKIYYLNRGSLTNWLEVNGVNACVENVTKHAMVRYLDEILTRKSPQCIVDISKIKNDLDFKERQQKIAVGSENNLSIAVKALPAEIAQLKEELARLQSERAALK